MINRETWESSLRKLKQEDCHEFKASLDYVARPGLKKHLIYRAFVGGRLDMDVPTVVSTHKPLVSAL